MPRKHMETRNFDYYSSRPVVESYPHDANTRAHQIEHANERMLTDPPFDPAMIIGDHPAATGQEPHAETRGANAKVNEPQLQRVKFVGIVMRNLFNRLLRSRQYCRHRGITRIDSKIVQLDVAMFRDRSRFGDLNLGRGSSCSADCSQQRWGETDKQILS